jgi:hypothetical protein
MEIIIEPKTTNKTKEVVTTVIENGVNSDDKENEEKHADDDVVPSEDVKTTTEPNITTISVGDDEEEEDPEIAEDHKNEDAAVLNKNTPLLWASIKGHLRVVWALLSEGYSSNNVDDMGNNAVHLSASNSHFKVLKTLVDDGGNCNAVNMYRNSPLELATQRDIRDYLIESMEKCALMTEKDIQNKHEQNLKGFNRLQNNLISTINETNSTSPRGGFKGASLLDYTRRLADCIEESKVWGVDTAIILQGEQTMIKLEVTQDLMTDTLALQQETPMQSQEKYVQYVHKLERTLMKAENAGVERQQIQFAKDLIVCCQIEYWISVLALRLTGIDCARDCNEHDMIRLKQAILKGQALRAADSIVDAAVALLGKMEAELGMSRALIGIPTITLPPVIPKGVAEADFVVPEGWWQECDTGQIKETEGYPAPPEGGVYIWEPSEAYTSLQKSVVALKASLNGAEELNANPDVIAESKAKIVVAEKQLKSLDHKNEADKVIAIDAATKLAKKLKKGKKGK